MTSTKDVNFIFRLFNKIKTQRKFSFSINFIVQHIVLFAVQIYIKVRENKFVENILENIL